MPKVKIVYSTIYDAVVQEWKSNIKSYDEQKFERINRDVWNPKRIRKCRKYATDLQKRWNKIEAKAFGTLSKVSGLKWKEKYITCYVLDTAQSFSDPLTITMSSDFDYDCESIIHELVHRLEFQNQDKIKWAAFNRAFGGETDTTKYHITVHSILKLAFPVLFGDKETEGYIKQTDWPDYRRAWQIVESYGPEKIIQDFIRPQC